MSKSLNKWMGVIALAFAPIAPAAIIFEATLTTVQEVPPIPPTALTTATGAPRPPSSGEADLVLNDAQTELSMIIRVFNIDVTGTQTADTNDNLVAAHIHAPAPPGTNAGVRFGFFGTPFNDNNPNNFVLTPFSAGVGGDFRSVWNAGEGNATTLTAQLPSILAGLSYLNFHTVQFPGGEIRGQILKVSEPPTWALGALAALMLAASIARRRRA
ncbi:MAG TPA: CHRD domain-containing protein [Casimicrobiaceae bacterium]|nr:CHRD domain-containing protein [Casimicrobiaceae bacterium]